MPDLSGADLVREWQKVTEAMIESASSVAGHTQLPRRLLDSMQHQLALVQELVERERRAQGALAGALTAPFDAIFDLFEESARAMRSQAEALGAAGRALEETSGLVQGQAELFERTITLLRQPLELAKIAADPRPRDARPACGA